MKYIRTKEGIIIDVSNVILQDRLTIKDIKDMSEETGLVARYEGVEIIKYSDTIEELCDEFVIDCLPDCNSIYKEDYPHIGYYRTIKELQLYKDFIIYGAIWTDKGLIYVAKLNDKGEWELL